MTGGAEVATSALSRIMPPEAKADCSKWRPKGVPRSVRQNSIDSTAMHRWWLATQQLCGWRNYIKVFTARQGGTCLLAVTWQQHEHL